MSFNDQLQRLQAFLDADDLHDEALDYMAACGYLSALAISPEPVADEELLAELSSQLPSEKGTPVAQYREKLRAMMACKSSIRARENITSQEAVRLIQDLIQAEHSPYCPHGRPTRIRLDETTLERLFHRS